MNSGMQPFHYICKACKKSITHRFAVNLVVEKVLQNTDGGTGTTSKEIVDGQKKVENDQQKELQSTRLHQQLYGPATTWLGKQRESALNNNFKRMTSMLNRGGLQCPYCKARGSWLWNCCAGER
ncbi:uncharacterized protein BXIN_1302 [Babesia sp. Xinjiang]|uniref:uncharacterized protein n=1 Tax=Babesia sp. Xinjiang TaxID=462227 RepID=UPI000A23A0EF|nr:uncharacterized protein BXIN_1302 [Babesia sp. Xinjiang]ORM40160.1 hypothetical protein BXIN_1302 [Babesia sp. Xinjiang]